MPHRTTSKPRTLRIRIDSLRSQLVEDGSLKPKAHLSLWHEFCDQIFDPLGRLEIEMLIAAGGSQAAAIDCISEHPLACLARRGSGVEPRCQLGARFGEIPLFVFRAGILFHRLFGHDARRSLAAGCFAVAASR